MFLDNDINLVDPWQVVPWMVFMLLAGIRIGFFQLLLLENLINSPRCEVFQPMLLEDFGTGLMCWPIVNLQRI